MSRFFRFTELLLAGLCLLALAPERYVRSVSSHALPGVTLIDMDGRRLPLSEAYDKALASEIADMKNVGDRAGGSITAAQFLQRFVNDVPWAHIDIAGTAWNEADASWRTEGASGFGARLLTELALRFVPPAA